MKHEKADLWLFHPHLKLFGSVLNKERDKYSNLSSFIQTNKDSFFFNAFHYSNIWEREYWDTRCSSCFFVILFICWVFFRVHIIPEKVFLLHTEELLHFCESFWIMIVYVSTYVKLPNSRKHEVMWDMWHGAWSEINSQSEKPVTKISAQSIWLDCIHWKIDTF